MENLAHHYSWREYRRVSVCHHVVAEGESGVARHIVNIGNVARRSLPVQETEVSPLAYHDADVRVYVYHRQYYRVVIRCHIHHSHYSRAACHSHVLVYSVSFTFVYGDEVVFTVYGALYHLRRNELEAGKRLFLTLFHGEGVAVVGGDVLSEGSYLLFENEVALAELFVALRHVEECRY